MDNIGERIRYLRKKNNLTQEKLSDLLGVMIYKEKAKAAMKKGDYDGAVKALKTAKKHAVLFDEMNSKGIEKYTCSILDGYTEDHRKDRKDDDWNMTDSVKAYAEQNIFDAIRKRDDFKVIFS